MVACAVLGAFIGSSDPRIDDSGVLAGDEDQEAATDTPQEPDGEAGSEET